MIPLILAALILSSLGFAAPSTGAPAGTGERVGLTLDTSEADEVLAILDLRRAGEPVGDAQWRKLFDTAPYRRLRQREEAIARQFGDTSRAFSDEDFKRFVLSDSLLARAARLRETLKRWKQADLNRTAAGILTYLPREAVLRARIHPVIKPRSNSFVWELSTDPTIFLFLDPEVTREKFENTVGHELHHVGLGSLGPIYDRKIDALPDTARAAARWMGAFGEGLAMLAAAGGPDVDPHAASTPRERARWTEDLARFGTDLPAVNRFFLDFLAGRLDESTVRARISSFFGEHQGPWYTVGYRMAVIVEKRFGRAALIGTMLDYRCLLALYNQAAGEANRTGGELQPLWSGAVLSRVGVGHCAAPSTSKP